MKEPGGEGLGRNKTAAYTSGHINTTIAIRFNGPPLVKVGK